MQGKREECREKEREEEKGGGKGREGGREGEGREREKDARQERIAVEQCPDQDQINSPPPKESK